MASRPIALVGIAGALVGALIGFLAGELLVGPPTALAFEGIAPRGTEKLGDGRPALVQPDLVVDHNERSSGVAHETRSAGPTDAGLARAIGRISAPEVKIALGDAAITGLVLDDRGEPLQGAMVYATKREESVTFSDPTKIAAGTADDPELEEVLRRAAESWAQRRAERSESRSGTDGRFALDGLLADANYNVWALAEGYIVEPLQRAHRVRAGEVVEFIARRVIAVRFELVDPSGAMAAEGVVELRRGDSTTTYKWSPAQPSIPLERGRVEARGFAGLGQQTERARGTVAADLASESFGFRVEKYESEPVQLVLAGRAGIRGRVIAGPAQQGNNLVTRILPLADAAEFDEKRLATADQENWQSGESFAFMDLAPGTYAIGSTTWEGSLLAHEIVVVVDRVVEVDLVLPEPDVDRVLLVTATDPGGVPVGRFDCQISLKNGNRSRATGLSQLRAKGGSIWFSLSEQIYTMLQEEPGGAPMQLTVTHRDWGSVQVELPRSSRETSVSFEEPVAVEVLLTGLDGAGSAGRLWVALNKASEAESMRYNYNSRDRKKVPLDGRVRFDGLSPGAYVVQLTVGQAMWGGTVVEQRDIDAKDAVTEIAMAAPVLYRLRVMAPGVAKGTRLSLNPMGDQRNMRGGSSASVDERGIAEFADLVAGEYDLRANNVQGRMTVSVPSADVLFEAQPYDALVVTIADVEGQLHRAGLRNGDMIIAVRGEDPRDSAQLQQLLYNEPADVDLQVTALRDGASRTFTLPGEGGSRKSKLGGSVRQAYRAQ